MLYLPVSAPELPRGAAVRREIRADLGTPDNAVVIVTACRLEAWKGHALLLEALGRLHGLPGWQWWIAGSPQRPQEQRYLAELQARVTGLGLQSRVRFLGHRPDVARVLAAADIHCQPNTGPEPFGIAFVEALYAELPVVTSALGGALEIVDDTCGILVPPGDVDRLAAVLRELIDSAERRRQLGAGGPARAALLCDPATQLSEIVRILTSMTCRTAHAVAS